MSIEVIAAIILFVSVALAGVALFLVIRIQRRWDKWEKDHHTVTHSHDIKIKIDEFVSKRLGS